MTKSASDTCPNCDSRNVFSELGAHKFPYGVAPDTVMLECVALLHYCRDCHLIYTDHTAETAQELAVAEHLRAKESSC